MQSLRQKTLARESREGLCLAVQAYCKNLLSNPVNWLVSASSIEDAGPLAGRPCPITPRRVCSTRQSTGLPFSEGSGADPQAPKRDPPLP